MTDLSSVLFLFTLVQIPWFGFRLAGIRLLFSMISFSILPFLDCFCLHMAVSISSFALKSPAIIISFDFDLWVIW